MKEKSEEKHLREGNISLVLDSYNEIFSDFDPRPSAERGLSIDFLDECRRALREGEGGVELRLLIPKNKRESKEEVIIKRRLKAHFTKHVLEKQKEVKKIRLNGSLLIGLGIVMMFVSYLVYSEILFAGREILKNIALIITEPAGWFLFWIGGEKFVYKVKEILPDYVFYKKMYESEISFHNY